MDVVSEQPPRLRRRKPTTKVEDVEPDGVRVPTRRRQTWLQSIEYAPSYAPTKEEFEDPLKFMRRVEPEAERYGICKITVPPEFRRRVDRFPEKLREFVFTVREQKLREHAWDNFGKTEIIYEHPQPFDLKQFQQKAEESAEKLLKGSALLPPSFVESEFWRLRNSPDSRDVYVLYGNDVEGTACDRDDKHNIGSTAWNLQDLGKAPWSLLRHAPMEYPGITTPMLYIGSLFSTFFWHVEDHWMHSVNFSHYGATKTWYGVPSSHADAFEKVVLEKVYRRAVQSKKIEIEDADFIKKCALKQLLAKNTLFLPKLLIDAGIPIFKLDQEPGDLVLTFPRGYHAGFSHGFNIGEAVNFALPEWLRVGQASLGRYCELGIPHILPHQMLLLKEAAALFDRLQKGRRQPDRIEVLAIQQFCAFADEHARLRSQISDERGLEEMSIADPLKSQICFVCYRQICGCFVLHMDTCCARCMQCSVRASHITDPEWKLAVSLFDDALVSKNVTAGSRGSGTNSLLGASILGAPWCTGTRSPPLLEHSQEKADVYYPSHSSWQEEENEGRHRSVCPSYRSACQRWTSGVFQLSVRNESYKKATSVRHGCGGVYRSGDFNRSVSANSCPRWRTMFHPRTGASAFARRTDQAAVARGLHSADLA